MQHRRGCQTHERVLVYLRAPKKRTRLGVPRMHNACFQFAVEHREAGRRRRAWQCAHTYRGAHHRVCFDGPVGATAPGIQGVDRATMARREQSSTHDHCLPPRHATGQCKSPFRLQAWQLANAQSRCGDVAFVFMVATPAVPGCPARTQRRGTRGTAVRRGIDLDCRRGAELFRRDELCHGIDLPGTEPCGLWLHRTTPEGFDHRLGRSEQRDITTRRYAIGRPVMAARTTRRIDRCARFSRGRLIGVGGGNPGQQRLRGRKRQPARAACQCQFPVHHLRLPQSS